MDIMPIPCRSLGTIDLLEPSLRGKVKHAVVLQLRHSAESGGPLARPAGYLGSAGFLQEFEMFKLLFVAALLSLSAQAEYGGFQIQPLKPAYQPPAFQSAQPTIQPVNPYRYSNGQPQVYCKYRDALGMVHVVQCR